MKSGILIVGPPRHRGPGLPSLHMRPTSLGKLRRWPAALDPAEDAAPHRTLASHQNLSPGSPARASPYPSVTLPTPIQASFISIQFPRPIDSQSRKHLLTITEILVTCKETATRWLLLHQLGFSPPTPPFRKSNTHRTDPSLLAHSPRFRCRHLRCLRSLPSRLARRLQSRPMLLSKWARTSI